MTQHLELSTDPVVQTQQILEAVEFELKGTALQLARVVHAAQMGLASGLVGDDGESIKGLEKDLRRWGAQLVAKTPTLGLLLERNWELVDELRAKRAAMPEPPPEPQPGEIAGKQVLNLPTDYDGLKAVGDLMGLPHCPNALSYTDAIVAMPPEQVAAVLLQLKGLN